MLDKSISRREFLKLAGIAGATAGLAGGLGGLVAACGAEETTTTTTAALATTTSGAAGTTTSVEGSTTTVSAAVETGREIKIGVDMPITGMFAVLAAADEWGKNLVEATFKDGLVCGDGKNHPISILLRDAQSDSARAAQVAGDLIVNDKVDILLGGGSPSICNPAADQAEALGCPFIGQNDPWEAFVMGRGYDLAGKKPMKWTYLHCLGAGQIHQCLADAFNKVPNNKKIALLFPNDADGQAQADPKTGAPPVYEAMGYQVVAPALYPPGAEDFTDQITQFKKSGCDVLSGAVPTPDFANFWKQSLQQGFHPKVPSMSLAIGFPKAIEALGAAGLNLMGEGGWNRTWPFTDWITGMTCGQLSDQYEKDTGQQWVPSIGSTMDRYEIAFDALKRTTNVDDKNAIIDAFKTAKLEAVGGPVDFTAPVDANPFAVESFRPYPNVVKGCLGAHQWVKGTKWPFEPATVSALGFPKDSAKPPVVAPVPYVY
ncbi:MAG: ABC transporter substrate-binding protein [Actinobacteria bacterium]|nr:ABC transporter substrate-binding protein [Actinomycetota bacterium]